MTTPQTFIYSAHNIEFDAYIPSITGNVPALILFHGGAMVSGSKRDISFPAWLVEKALPRGIMVIAANYRLLHPSTTEDIITDVHDLFKYLADPTSEFSVFLSGKSVICDVNRIAVVGDSGGNYPARAAATLSSVLPRPKAWISLYGMGGDFLLDHWVQIYGPDDTFGLNWAYDPAVAMSVLEHGSPVSDAPLTFNLQTGMANDPHNRLGIFIHWRRHGAFLDYVLGVPGMSNQMRELSYEKRWAAVPEGVRKFLLPVTTNTSPAFLIHGTRDDIVPQAESLKTWKDLQEMGVKSKHAWLEGAGHGLMDPNNMPNRVAGWEQAVDRALDFVVDAFAC